MSEPSDTRNLSIAPNKSSIYWMEALVIILTSCVSLFLQNGSIDFSILTNNYSILTIIGSMSLWFSNRLILEYILQSRIESNKITLHLPLELLGISVLISSVVYIIFFLLLTYTSDIMFVLTPFLKGFSVTIGLTLLIVILYIGRQVWTSWLSDGESIFQMSRQEKTKEIAKGIITIKNSKTSINIDLDEVGYFYSEDKIVFLVTVSGKKMITQYNLSELEEILDGRFFRLNRSTMVCRSMVSHIRKLPNHRLLVTIGHDNATRQETISRYKSTKFKRWIENIYPPSDHSAENQ